MTSVSKKFYFDVLDNIVNKHNNTYHRVIKIKPTDVKPDSYAEYNVDSNEKYPKFQADDHVRISKFKNIFAKRYTPNQKKFLLLAKLKIKFHRLMLLKI